MSDPATFNFNLTAPAGAVWAASLTNGLDFKLLSEGDYVSQGITRVIPFYIRIVPTKTFSVGADRQSRFYITVDGQKATINPNGAGGPFDDGRKYPGTETEILIKQIQ